MNVDMGGLKAVNYGAVFMVIYGLYAGKVKWTLRPAYRTAAIDGNQCDTDYLAFH